MRPVAQALRAVGRLPRRALRRVRARLAPSVPVLLYHRVAEPDVDPWGLCVSPRHFDEHLGVLRRRGPVLPFSAAAAALRAGRLPRGAAVVTFDDGYADNLHAGLPLLERHGLPATVFLTTGDGGRAREFWWDELERVLLWPGTLPRRLCLDVGGVVVERDLGDAAAYTEADHHRHKTWRAWDPPPTARHAAYLDLWERLIERPSREQRAVLDRLLAWAEQDAVVRPTHRTVSWEEAGALGRGGLVEVGAHTVTHPALPALSAEAQRAELAASREALEARLGCAVRTCAYPYGRHAAETLAAARAAGFEAAATTEPRALRPGDDALATPRLAVADVDGDAFGAFLADSVAPHP